MRIRRSVHAGLVAVAAAAGTMLAAPLAHAAPWDKVNCVPVPIASRLEVTCTNTAAEAATATMIALCSDLRILHEPEFPIAPADTVTFTRDCGAGATLLLWNASGETISERAQRRERERSDEQEKQRKQREQSDQDDKQREQERKRRSGY
ncbi:hypothetical protein [Nocardia sp. NBC_00403]|uniref:hypothetical protein n=1 Tax=Nocardia sp. NBC_00403 TaxID=2975990 RepID=UPI002E21D5C9